MRKTSFPTIFYIFLFIFSTSTSQLSISSGSSLGSLGSLGSLSASSHGSLASTSMTDIYSQPQLSNENLQDLHRCVGQRLLGYSISPGLAEKELAMSTPSMGGASGPSLLTSAALPTQAASVTATSSSDNGSGATGSSSSSSSHPLSLRKVQGSQQPQGATGGATGGSEQSSLSPHSSFSSLSPPTSPYDIGPPPSYEQHMNAVERQKRLVIGTTTTTSTATTNTTTVTKRALTPSLSTGSDSALPHVMHNTNSTGAMPLFQVLPYMLQVLDSDVSGNSSHGNPVNKQAAVNTQSAFVDNTDIASNPPLSPISESSSGVCNNLSGVNTSSVSAAVSDESVTGDSGVFEASVKR